MKSKKLCWEECKCCADIRLRGGISLTTVCHHIALGNTSAINEMIRRVLKQFGPMLERKAFLHWYTGEGMEAAEFKDCQHNIVDLTQEYESLARDVGGAVEGGDAESTGDDLSQTE
ncbi:unnamed protein product [Nesidiocoris tenuis]|uniref:Tubulin/FtsZ 2-layer sandwich domain-containing protein n=1 Tax=Nesidiocoris tenuis TaxID=355587 RepID=A0A6H5HBE7_9HEMI|nr:unnamed protein product [Nesidiocoris tenuis]